MKSPPGMREKMGKMKVVIKSTGCKCPVSHYYTSMRSRTKGAIHAQCHVGLGASVSPQAYEIFKIMPRGSNRLHNTQHKTERYQYLE